MTCEIVAYLHCKQCLTAGGSERLAVGWTKQGMQVWCEHCDSNVIHLDFEGRKVRVIAAGKEENSTPFHECTYCGIFTTYPDPEFCRRCSEDWREIKIVTKQRRKPRTKQARKEHTQ